MRTEPDPQLIESVRRAESDLRDRLANTFGHPSPVGTWLDTRFGGNGLADVFLAPGAYPVIRMPWWAAGEALRSEDRTSLAASSIAGYLFIRIVDDVADGDHAVPAAVLPSLGFFHTEFTRVFREWFAADDAFWAPFERWWSATAAAAVDDLASGPVDQDTFERSAARKTEAAVIPVAAALRRIGRPDSIDAWERFVVAFGRWHQFQNDLEGLATDQARGATTWIISTARAEAPPGMSPRAWAWTLGFDWIVGQFDAYAQAVQKAAIPLGSAVLDAYFARRVASWRETFDTVLAQLDVISAATEPEE